MEPLSRERAAVETARAEGGLPLARALIALGEVEPLFRYRTQAVRALLTEAAELLDTVDDAELRGRTFLRLATVKMTEEDNEGAEQLLGRAREYLERANATGRLVDAQCLAVRLCIRRSKLTEARTALAVLSALIGQLGDQADVQRATTTLALALGELSLMSDGEEATAEQLFRELLGGIAEESQWADATYLAYEALALCALHRQDPAAAVNQLRHALALTKQFGATEDELQVRVRLASFLVMRDDIAGREEAERQLQIARDRAIEHNLDGPHMAALLGQVGLMAKRGKTQGALDRCLEIAQSAVAKKDLSRYGAAVSLMSQIYEQNGDFPSAYKAFAEARDGLTRAVGEEAATALIGPQIDALAERMGRPSFEAMLLDIERGRQLAARLKTTGMPTSTGNHDDS